MNLRSLGILSLPVVILMLMACERRPSYVMSDAEMIDVLIDLELAEAYVSTMPTFEGDSARRVMRQAVLADHKITEAKLDSSLQWYGGRMEKYVDLQDKVAAELRRRESVLSGQDGTSADAGTGIWPYARMVRFSRLSQYNGLLMSVSGTELMKGDRLEWSGFMVCSGSKLNMLLGVDYEDGEQTFVWQEITPHGRFNIVLQTDSLKLVKRIFGSVMSQDGESPEFMIDSLSLSKTPLNREIYDRIFAQRFFPPKRKTVNGDTLAAKALGREQSVVKGVDMQESAMEEAASGVASSGRLM